MLSLTRFNLCFTPSRQMFLLTVIAVALFVRLGLWQLDRGHEKQRLLRTSQAAAKRPPILWHAGDSMPHQYQSLQVHGHFLSATLLLDNQHHQHRFGYDVLSPLELADGSVVI